ncbi:helix-turn-helix transcriptional regulator [Falsiruegeria mediterranea]|uniref:Uncharacterized protein n=1 Tax=Falsiruegeria mediterranea M17 TaxID=1200281 RepID=A0A2R8C896_9RHOB|nr:AlpA family phage regulatory protein [Falsiruegeria mediterranea]SPJ28664.1 hypothetical protein TRM7615_02167 [Falsiruegeria mediterranea M17]
MNAPLMIDVEALSKTLKQVVGDQLDARAPSDRDTQIKQAELVTAILAKPIMALPEDLTAVTGFGSTAAYKLIGRPNFPKTFKLGKRRYCYPADFLAALPGIQTDETRPDNETREAED